MYYYEGSVLPIEWTNQHGCGPNSKVNCEIIIQVSCQAAPPLFTLYGLCMTCVRPDARV